MIEIPAETDFVTTAKWVCLNGVQMEANQVKVSPFDRGYLFADGVYEGVSFVHGRMVDNQNHFARLHNSLQQLGMHNPWSDKEIAAMQQELMRANSCDEGFCYYQITRGIADRDFIWQENTKPQLLMFLQPKAIVENPQTRQGIKVACVPDTRWKRRSIKSIALLPQVLAKQQAKEKNCYEAWMVENGEVNEGSSTSAFIVDKHECLWTAPLSERILPGVTRKALLALAREQGIEVRETHFTPQQAIQAAEAFISSASMLVMPVVEIDSHRIGNGKPGRVTTLLRQLYIERYCSREASV